MAWWGKAIGGAFGFMVGGPLGALMGVAFGHNFDRRMIGIEQSDWTSGGGDQDRVQAAFFTATFSVMGYIAKADGKVTRDEIRLAEEVMRQLGLDGEMRESAKKLFNEGKSENFPIDEILDQFKSELKHRTTLVQMFLEIQLQAAYADGVMDASEEKALAHICQRLGIPLSQLKRMEEMLKAGFGGQRQKSSTQGSLSDAYAIVGVENTVSDAELKKAYRRLMSQHHPDKLVAKGLPDEMIKDATAKTQQIKAAYEQIRKTRGS
jgi:DnaJ like chaperone protein|tara:strand:- start:91 stop:882 length:792 start_codon:yes stop_codon:yes gene_type:complete